MRFCLVILFLFFATIHVQAQELSNFRITKIATKGTIILDSLSIIEASFQIEPAVVESDYSLDFIDASLTWRKPIAVDSVTISYRVYPYKFNKKIYNQRYAAFLQEQQEQNFFINTNVSEPTENTTTIDFGQLQYSGNFSRGVSFGNAQSLNLNSGFNIQLAGMLTNDIEVSAVITDNNIPIQPEGNTAQLQEFDKVFVQLKKDEHTVVVGDFDLLSPPSYFMKFQRNLQGASYSGSHQLNAKSEVSGKASVAVARGQFAFNIINPEEGNQGPYRLTDANGSSFIIILAGSERVFINGVLQERGANKDYVIDYNLGEVTFTPNQLITQELRIRIEFEYSDRNYFRSLYHFNGNYQHEKFAVRTNFFAQQDAKNQPLNIELNDNQKLALAQAGDQSDLASVSSIQAVEFDETLILYALIDTVINGQADTILQYSTNEELPLYSASFNLVGTGKGSYQPSVSAANGRVFTYLGEGLGSYEPIQLLVAPQKSQMASVAFDVYPTKNTVFTNEIAVSNKDVNTFSDIDDGDNVGLGFYSHLVHKIDLKDTTKQFTFRGDYEFKQAQFNSLERYRPVTFNIDWNLSNPTIEQEHLAAFSSTFTKAQMALVQYQFTTFHRSDGYQGYDQDVIANYQDKGWAMNSRVRWMLSDNNVEQSSFFRPALSVQKSFEDWNGWSLGFFTNNEVNRISDVATDTLTQRSFLWQEYGMQIASPDTQKNQYQFIYKLRYQHIAKETSFDDPYLRANTFTFKGRMVSLKNQQLNWNLTYRYLQQDTLIQADDDLEHFYLGRIDYNFNVFKGAISGNSLYEIGAGREQRQQYTYLAAPDGQGAYAWQDFNENGVQEIDEFYVSTFTNENRFIRIRVSAPEFVPVNATRFNQSIYLKPANVWLREKGLKGFIARFSTNTSIQVSQKIFASSNVKAWQVISPYAPNLNDSLLVSNNTAIRQIIFFNRTNTTFGMEYNYVFNNNVTLLTGGFERRKLLAHEFKLRWNFYKTLTLNGGYRTGFKVNDSDFYFDRRYEYLFNETNLNFTWLHKRKLRIELNYDYRFLSNPLPEIGGQFSVTNQASIVSKYTLPGKSAIQARLAYAAVGYVDGGTNNEQLKFDMLQGLQNGNNYIWNASFDRTIANNLQLSIIYEGRKTGEDAVVHTGRAQVSAIF